MNNKNILKYSGLISRKDRKINPTESILYGIVTGEALFPQFYSKRQGTQAFYGLRRYKFIRRTKVADSDSYRHSATSKGEERLRRIILDEIEIKIPRRWDGKWRLVMYDLPIRFKKARDAFRWKLKNMGFFQFQKSAWIYPYPCEKEVLFVADFYGVRKHIEILEVNKVLHEEKLKKHFEVCD